MSMVTTIFMYLRIYCYLHDRSIQSRMLKRSKSPDARFLAWQYSQCLMNFGSASFDDDLGIGDFTSPDEPPVVEQIAEADVQDFTDLWDSDIQEEAKDSWRKTNEPLHIHIHSLDLMVEGQD